jgi:hypothetical protein
VEATTDTNGGQNVGWIDANDWMDYNVTVATAGSYTLSYRAASLSGGGSVQVRSGATTLVTTSIPSTSGWQTWTTVTSTAFNLSAGSQTIRIFAPVGGFNLNWMQFQSACASSVAITSPANGATFTAPASVAINVSATSCNAISKIDFYNGSTLIGTDTSSPYSFAWNNVAAGSYTLTARLTDSQGNVLTTTTVNITVNGSNPAPTVSITAPANNATFIAPATINITANASDTTPGTVSSVSFYNGAALLGTDTSSPYSFSWTNVATGPYSITARATDNQGAIGNSSVITVVVNGSNTPPTTSITSPANNASFTAPASIAINANAGDANGMVAKVEFFQGATKLGEDTTSPYSFTWTSVAAGTYALTTRATDNGGATGTSSVVNITVIGGTGCSYPQYVENGNYVAGSLVKNAGSYYECKPHPFTGWCNGAAWAYAPGTGTYWADAWILKGSCSGRSDTRLSENVNEFNGEDGVSMFPNPGKSGKEHTITLEFDNDPGDVNIQLKNMNGATVSPLEVGERRGRTITVNVPAVSSGIYLLRIAGSKRCWFKKYTID